MKPVQFLSNSHQIDNIVKGFTLTKSLFVSSLIVGEKHTGKKTLIQTLYPHTIYIDAGNSEELFSALEKYDEVVIYNFEKIINFENLNFENKRIIAIANHIENSIKIEKKFAFIYHMPKLEERVDLDLLIKYFQDKIQKDLMLDFPIDIDKSQLDFSQNLKSLKASMYQQLIKKTLSDHDIEGILFEYLIQHIDGNNAYREHLPLYEKPLIKAGLHKYKSQLKLSNILGLNRNTLRKKIQEHGLD
ncbi:Fis family transcriptional regulator [bacterium]|nr:Fis family transcriptional regulator [bacterium]MBU1958104.1 Fis family transcriptional regulator [bacterium]